MDYDEFARRFLTALHYETERTGQPYHRAENLLKKYDLNPKPHWIARVTDDWENWYFRDVSKVLGGYEGWSFRISGEGARFVEDDFKDEAEMLKFLEPRGNDLEIIADRLAPAAGRMVTLKDNAPLREEILIGLDEIRSQVSSSNTLEPGEREDVTESLSLAKRLIQQSSRFLVGAFNYLVVERLKKAFEKTIEDTIRIGIIAILSALALSILAVL